MAVEVGMIVDGIVSKITNFGAFINFGNKESGLCHISELSYSYVKNVSDMLKIGDKVKVKIIDIDSNKKINLSIRQTASKLKEKKEFEKQIIKSEESYFKKPLKDFEGMLSSFIKNSDENQSSSKKNSKSSRRSNGYSNKK